MFRPGPSRSFASFPEHGRREITPIHRGALPAAFALTALVLLASSPSPPAHAGGGKPANAPQSAPWGQGDDAETERFLLEGNVVEMRDIGQGVTRSKKVTLKLGDRVGHAIFKIVREEHARSLTGTTHPEDLYFSDRFEHEVAAYRVDRLVGLGRVPVSVLRRIDGETGSLQSWVENAYSERERVEKGLPLADSARYAEDSTRMFMFDALIYNVDRNQENILITDPGTRMWLIDHSRSFRLRKELPPSERSRKAPLKIDPGFLQEILAPTDEAIRTALKDLLTKGQIDALLARRKKLAALGTKE